MRVMAATDPFGHRLRFAEPRPACRRVMPEPSAVTSVPRLAQRHPDALPDEPVARMRRRDGLYADGMKELDHEVGALLDLLDDLGVADNAPVMFSADNGAMSHSWPDGGNHPFRGEHRPLAADGVLPLHRDDLPLAALR